MSFTPIGNILSGNIRQTGIGRQVQAAIATEVFGRVIGEIFGEAARKKTKALYLRDGNLIVESLSSTMIQEMYLKRAKIINEINKKMGGAPIQALKFRM